MKLFKSLLFLTFMLFITATLSQCAGGKQLQTNVPFEMGDVYYQEWVAGVKGGGSGVNIFIPVISNSKNILLDSVYFHGKQAKLEHQNNAVFIGRFETETNLKKDFIMSNEPFAEYGNKVPEIPQKIPFKLNENECVVSYKLKNKLIYYKIERINKKEALQYMGVKPNKQ